MAIEFIASVLKLRIPTGPKFVLVALANRANENGYCWPSQSDLANQTSMSIRSVRGHIAWLVSNGYLSKHTRRRENGSYTSDGFVVLPKEPAADSADGKKRPQPAADSAGPETSLIKHHNLNKGGFAPLSKAVGEKGGSRLTSDWILPENCIVWARSEKRLSDVEIKDQYERFKDYWISKSGRDGVKKDWEAAWRNWVRRSIDYKTERKGLGSVSTKQTRVVMTREEVDRQNQAALQALIEREGLQ